MSTRSFKQSITLSGVVFNLEFRFNSRMAAWIMNIRDAGNADLLIGVPIRESFPLTYKYLGRIVGLPNGLIFCLDATGQHREPDATLFRTDCNLLYGGL